MNKNNNDQTSEHDNATNIGIISALIYKAISIKLSNDKDKERV